MASTENNIFDRQGYGFIEGEETTDIMESGGSNPLLAGQSAMDRVQAEMEGIFRGIDPVDQKKVFGVETENTKRSDAANERAQKPGFWEGLIKRSIYVLVGLVFLIIGLVILARGPVRQGVVEGVKDALAE